MSLAKFHYGFYGQLLRYLSVQQFTKLIKLGRISWTIRKSHVVLNNWLLMVNHRHPPSDFSWGGWMAIHRLEYLHWILFLLSHTCKLTKILLHVVSPIPFSLLCKNKIVTLFFKSWRVDLSVIWFDQPAQISNTWFLKMGHHSVDWFRITWLLEWGWLSEDACLRGGDQHFIVLLECWKTFLWLIFQQVLQAVLLLGLLFPWMPIELIMSTLFSLAV